MSFSSKIKKLSQESGIIFKDFGNGHLQLKKTFSVNIYESTQSFYINGMVKKEKYPMDDPELFLIKVAMGEQDFDNSRPWLKEKRKNLSRKNKIDIWKKNPTCWICKNKIENVADLTWEHKVPLDKLGSNRPDNLTISHAECNHLRGNKVSV